jgi:hypothetical protein
LSSACFGTAKGGKRKNGIDSGGGCGLSQRGRDHCHGSPAAAAIDGDTFCHTIVTVLLACHRGTRSVVGLGVPVFATSDESIVDGIFQSVKH